MKRTEKATYKYAPLLAAGVTFAFAVGKAVAQRWAVEREWRLELSDVAKGAGFAAAGLASFWWSHEEEMDGFLTMG